MVPLELPVLPGEVEPLETREASPCARGTCAATGPRDDAVLKFLVWCILFVLCWPLALLALVLYPLVWLIQLPFRILGIAVTGTLALLKGIIFFPARMLGERPR